MALLDYVPHDTENERVRQLLEADAAVYGRPSLFARTLAHNPSVLEARQEYVRSLVEAGTLDTTEAELAYVAVAVSNECSYCVASHTERLVEHIGVPQETVDAIIEGDESPFTDRERAIVWFARAAASKPK